MKAPIKAFEESEVDCFGGVMREWPGGVIVLRLGNWNAGVEASRGHGGKEKEGGNEEVVACVSWDEERGLLGPLRGVMLISLAYSECLPAKFLDCGTLQLSSKCS